MKLITIFILLFAFTVNAETRLIVPLATTHIGGGDFDNTNPGIGIEYKKDNNYVYSATYLRENSYSEPSIYLAASKETEANFWIFKTFKKETILSAGIAAGSGYEKISDSGILVVPIFGIRYEGFRVITSFPAAQIFCPPGQDCGDFVNLQYVHEF